MPELPLCKTIAIDGPAASGKSTLGFLLAEQLGFLYLDTGCMYRAVTLAALNRNVPIDSESGVSQLARRLEMEIKSAGEEKDGRKYTVILDGKDVTWDLRLPIVDLHVSQVSAYEAVREELVRRQRRLAQVGKIVVVGRDIGTVVLPGAPVKFYIIATPEERAIRRWLERTERDDAIVYEEILTDLIRRDTFDGGRRFSPMQPAEDAIIIDTTGLTTEGVLDRMLEVDRVRELLPA